MGMLIEGRWSDVDPIQETGKDGDFRRVESVYREFITADGSSGFRAEPQAFRKSPRALTHERSSARAPHARTAAGNTTSRQRSNRFIDRTSVPGPGTRPWRD